MVLFPWNPIARDASWGAILSKAVIINTFPASRSETPGLNCSPWYNAQQFYDLRIKLLKIFQTNVFFKEKQRMYYFQN